MVKHTGEEESGIKSDTLELISDSDCVDADVAPISVTFPLLHFLIMKTNNMDRLILTVASRTADELTIGELRQLMRGRRKIQPLTKSAKAKM